MSNLSLKNVPQEPGVYFFKNSRDEIIYIGKAKNLKKRLQSYFSSSHDHSPKTKILVQHINYFDYIIVDNEVESLLLENKLIKKHSPKYNINLKDSKTFAYIKITDEEIPKIMMTRKVTKHGTYFGPFTDGRIRNTLFNLTVSLFTLVTSKTYSSKSSLYYEIGRAPAKSLNSIDKNQYYKNIEKAKRFLLGKDFNKIHKELEEEMKEASKNYNFEKALLKKRQIESLLYLEEQQKVDTIKSHDQDVVVHNYQNSLEKSIIMVFHISKGVISSKEEFSFTYDNDVFLEFIKVFYSKKTPPNEIIINESIWDSEEDKKVIESYLSKLRGSQVSLTHPQKGEKKHLVKLAEKNTKYFSKNLSIIQEMKKKLSLPKTPSIIECFDMSNLGSDYYVGAMTRWIDGKPDKQGYRKFELKTLKQQDDFKAMHETVKRRYTHLKKENKQYPDLIIIDGGKGQLSAATSALKELNVEIPIISLAKKQEEIFFPQVNEPLILDKNSPVMLYIRSIRDSVHNFVLSYNRKKREMRLKDEYSQIKS